MLKTWKATLALLIAWLLCISSVTVMAKTAAGVKIQNKASASYRFVGDTTVYTAASNIVTTIVQQVAGTKLENDSSKFAVAGRDILFPHIVRNTGNDNDSYSLSVADLAADYNFSTIEIFADEDHDGQPDDLNLPITSTGELAMGEAFYFVVVGTTPESATVNQKGRLTVTATSGFDNSKTVNNTDVATITDDAVIDVRKSMVIDSGAAGTGPYTVTLTYKNISQKIATDVNLIDKLPAGMSYVADSARWSVNSGLILTDADDGVKGTGSETIKVCAYNAACLNQFEAMITQVTAGNSGSVTFDININANLAAQDLLNVAEFKYNDGTSVTSFVKTNEVPFNVSRTVGVVINGQSTTQTNGAGEPVSLSEVAQGGSILFESYVWNIGNATDSFNITTDIVNTTFPQGTVFEFLKPDGATPLVDTNSDGIPDTGQVDSNKSFKLVVKATLPSTSVGNNGGNGYEVTIKATSTYDNAKNDTIINRLTAIKASQVDLQQGDRAGNIAIASQGAGAQSGDSNGSPLDTLTLQPGTASAFVLYVLNQSDRTDNFDLSHSASSSFNPSTNLPVSWSMRYYKNASPNNDCSMISDVITQTGLMNPGDVRRVCAVVEVPKTAKPLPVAQDIYFQIKSPITGANDSLRNAVNISSTAAIHIEPDQHAQVKPNLQAVHHHVLYNLGNESLEGVNIILTDTLASQGWKSIVYLDVNGDTKLDKSDVLLKDIILQPGDTKSVLVRVTPPSNAVEGTANTTQVQVVGHVDDGNPSTVSGTQLTSSVKDITTVSSSTVLITKEQALDANCDGVPDGPNTCSGDACYTVQVFSASQSQCLIYRLTAFNNSVNPVDNVRINDVAPMYTTFFTSSGLPTTTLGQVTPVTHGGDGSIMGGSIPGGAAVTLQSGATMVMKFAVQLE